MVYFPPAKLNLGLHILNKRADGFHDLEECVLAASVDRHVGDDPQRRRPCREARFEWSGLEIPGNASDNLVTRAHRLLADKHDLPGLSIHLHKILPMGAGLGGGSADGTYALRAINDVCELGLSPQELAHDAGLLGSDCPFFVQDGAALVHRRSSHVVVANPGIHIGEALRDSIDLSSSATSRRHRAVDEWWWPTPAFTLAQLRPSPMSSPKRASRIGRALRAHSKRISGIFICETTSKLAFGSSTPCPQAVDELLTWMAEAM